MITYKNLVDYFSKLDKNTVVLSRTISNIFGIYRPNLTFVCSRINHYSNEKATAETDRDLGITVGISNVSKEHIYPVIKLTPYMGVSSGISVKGTCGAWIEKLSELPSEMLNHEIMLLDDSYTTVPVNPVYGGIRIGPLDSTSFVYRCVSEEMQEYEIIYDQRHPRGREWAEIYIQENIYPDNRDQYSIYSVGDGGHEPFTSKFIIIDCAKRNNIRYGLSLCYREGFLA